MARLLHIAASPRVERSYSRRAARAFIEAYREAHPDDTVETWDLWADPPPEFNNAAAAGKYRILHGEEHTAEEAAAWQAVVETAERFKSADRYLLSCPMWNFGVPYKLKQLVDVIVQQTLTFSFSPDEGYTGLVTGKSAVVISSRGGNYEEGHAYDMQLPYIRLFLGFIGITDVRAVLIQPTLMEGKDVATEKLAAAIEEAEALAKAM